MTVGYRELMDAVEADFADERQLDQLERQASTDQRLDDDERRHVLDRIAFYRSDFHARLRAAEHIARGELDVPLPGE